MDLFESVLDCQRSDGREEAETMSVTEGGPEPGDVRDNSNWERRTVWLVVSRGEDRLVLRRAVQRNLENPTSFI